MRQRTYKGTDKAAKACYVKNARYNSMLCVLYRALFLSIKLGLLTGQPLEDNLGTWLADKLYWEEAPVRYREWLEERGSLTEK